MCIIASFISYPFRNSQQLPKQSNLVWLFCVFLKRINTRLRHKGAIYELVGVIVHSGQASAGHYYSYIKDRRYGVLHVVSNMAGKTVISVLNALLQW